MEPVEEILKTLFIHHYKIYQMGNKILFIVIITINWSYAQGVFLESNPLNSDEIIFKGFNISKSADTSDLFRTIGYPLSIETYRELEMDIEFAEIHHFYNYEGFKIYLFIANDKLYFDALLVNDSRENIILGNYNFSIGDSLNSLADAFPVSYKQYQAQMKEFPNYYRDGSFPFFLYFLHTDPMYGHYGRLRFIIKGGRIEGISISSFIE